MFWLNHLDLARKTKIIGITPAMPSGSSLIYDGGLSARALTSGAEQHAVTLGWNGNTGNDFFATFTRPFARL
jgi:deoxyxylulose-5-phosphate synthase